MMKFLNQNLHLEYSTAGPRTGIPIVFVHGFPFDQSMWRYQVNAFMTRYYIVTYDVRGHGKSEPGDYQYTIELFVDDLMALMDHLKIGRAVLVGLSMGGYISLRAIERHPDRIRALVLCDTRSEADTNEGKIRRAQQAEIVKRDGTKLFAEAFVRGLFHESTFSEKPEIVNQIRSTIESTPPLSIAGTLIALAARTDTTHALYNIHVPTLILVGKHDGLTPVSASTAMKEKIPSAEMHILPRAGHVSNLENSEEFNFHLQNFLQRLEPVPR